jgi:hypothetical protein
VAATVLLAGEGQVEQALELNALASRWRLVSNSRWFEDVVRPHITAVSAGLPAEEVASAEARGRAGDLDSTVAGLADCF